jgi:hypothetical protein
VCERERQGRKGGRELGRQQSWADFGRGQVGSISISSRPPPTAGRAAAVCGGSQDPQCGQGGELRGQDVAQAVAEKPTAEAGKRDIGQVGSVHRSNGRPVKMFLGLWGGGGSAQSHTIAVLATAVGAIANLGLIGEIGTREEGGFGHCHATVLAAHVAVACRARGCCTRRGVQTASRLGEGDAHLPGGSGSAKSSKAHDGLQELTHDHAPRVDELGSRAPACATSRRLL